MILCKKKIQKQPQITKYNNNKKNSKQKACVHICTPDWSTEASGNQPPVISGPRYDQWSEMSWCWLFTHKSLCPELLFWPSERGGEAEQQGVQSERTNPVPGPIIIMQRQSSVQFLGL